MNLFVRIIGTVAMALCFWPASATNPVVGKTVFLKDFLAPGDAERDAVPAVRAALEHCLEVGASRLVLPGGTLRMLPDRAAERYQYISNNSEGMKRIAFDLRGLRDFEIDGAGTELLFSGFVSPFSIEECERIEIHDLKIDYTRTFHSEGIVRAAGDGWLEVSFPGEYRCEEVNGCLHFYDERGGERIIPIQTCSNSMPCGANLLSGHTTTGLPMGRSRPAGAGTGIGGSTVRT